jgi:hypothetical protein
MLDHGRPPFVLSGFHLFDTRGPAESTTAGKFFDRTITRWI